MVILKVISLFDGHLIDIYITRRITQKYYIYDLNRMIYFFILLIYLGRSQVQFYMNLRYCKVRKH